MNEEAEKSSNESNILDEKYYDVKQVAKVVDLSEETIRRYIRAGKIKAVRMGRGFRIYESHLNEFIENLPFMGED
ncbi:helix-turn-helix domain-containing protein [Paenibacillus sp. MER 99-2]|uniref:helix-turn-helix domain-containing protein n=1 Tax=Paenibacillus sp. MER 99-2 TaxID=2939572 RepID=UPI00203CAD6D|nr:helix-turn-helix domain-containing protein [Paenibacillus sp. MER 99-2]MCM3176216.1 helix-turn-helix domain-containing protein [Paenibacillus sp. MER 99-2]